MQVVLISGLSGSGKSIALNAQKRDAALADECDAWAGSVVWADRVLLRLVLLNLLSNAVRFNRAGGTATIFCQPDGGTDSWDGKSAAPDDAPAKWAKPANDAGKATPDNI